jgi:putative FmdB family regulatory protein
MPFYEYQCKNCGHDLEAMQKINDAPLKKCPHCGKSQLQRLMSAPVFRLKGGGWYETDFKGDGDNKKNLADKPDADAPKDAAKDTAKEGAKEAADSGTDAKAKEGKEGKAGDGKASDGKSADSKDATKTADKSAAAPTEKAASADSGKRASNLKPSKRGAAPAPHRTHAKRPVKKAAPKAKVRR